MDRVRTNSSYPDGGIVDVFVKHGDQVVLTDLGETLGWVRLRSQDATRSDEQQRILRDICAADNVQLVDGQLVLRCYDPSLLLHCAMRLGEAAASVALALSKPTEFDGGGE